VSPRVSLLLAVYLAAAADAETSRPEQGLAQFRHACNVWPMPELRRLVPAYCCEARLQILEFRDLVRSFAYSTPSPGVLQYYKLTPAGYRFFCGPSAPLPSRAFFNPVSDALQEHTQAIRGAADRDHHRRPSRFVRVHRVLAGERLRAGDGVVAAQEAGAEDVGCFVGRSATAKL